METMLVQIHESGEHLAISGRELHAFLEVKTAYKDWFPRMCDYGFVEGVDFNPLKNEQVRLEGNRKVKRDITDHLLNLDMAKELCMLQRTERGKQARRYFIQVEKDWNSPQKVMARALEMAHRELEETKATLEEARAKNRELNVLVESQAQQIVEQEDQITEMQPKANYYNTILACPDVVTISVIAKDYGRSAQGMNSLLHDLHIQFKQGNIWLLYQEYTNEGYTQTKTYHVTDKNGVEHAKTHTYWTQKGRFFLYEFLARHGILPTIERNVT